MMGFIVFFTVLALIGVGAAGYLYWQRRKSKQPAAVEPPAAPRIEPAIPVAETRSAAPAASPAPVDLLSAENVKRFIAPVLERQITAAPAAPTETAMSTDKGIISAGQLLAGWLLPDDAANPPVAGRFANRHADLMYLTYMARMPGGNQVFEDVLTGSQGEVNVCKNYAHTVGNDGLYDEEGHAHDWPADPRVDPRVKQEAQASIAAEKARWEARGIKVPTHDFSRYHR